MYLLVTMLKLKLKQWTDFLQLEKLGYFTFVTINILFGKQFLPVLKWQKKNCNPISVSLKLIFNFDTGAYKGIGGFKAIGGLFPPVWHWQSFWELNCIFIINAGFS